jgi:uncharacterized protein DUF3892/PASTA domain-containing protein
MCVPVQFVTKDVAGRITHIGGSTDDGRPWGLTVAQAVAAIDSGEWQFFVEIPQGERTEVRVRQGASGRYLSTAPDNTTVNNLDNLPIRSTPLAAVEPPFPLSIPGPTRLIGVLKLRKVETGIHGVLTELQRDPQLPPNAQRPVFALANQYWNSPTPKWFYVTCRLPFPAIYEVFVNRAQITGQIDPVHDELEQIAGDNILRRQELEQAGRGWFSWDLTFKHPDGTPDPSAPERFSEIRLVLRPHDDCWRYHWFRVYVRPSSYNRYCSGFADSVYFEISIPITPPPASRPAPTEALVPDVKGRTLSDAMAALTGAGFTRLQVLGPSLPATQLRVDTQSPAAGEKVALTTTVWLSVSAVNVATGFSTISLHNISSRQKTLVIHSFDYVNGQWKREGTVDYQDTLDVALAKAHVYGIYAVDSTLIGCNSGQPTEADCVYWQPLTTFTGDDSGPRLTVEIT